MTTPVIDVLIPARSGSQGLPGKNGRVLIDRPLLAHSVACAQLVDGVRSIIVSTDDAELADIARTAGAQVPELRPAALAQHDTAMADVIRYALGVLDRLDPERADLICLLDPTSPLRDPHLVTDAALLVQERPAVDGAIAISTPAFNPIWVGVQVADDGTIRRHPLMSATFTRRQDVPPYWRINGSFYLWRPEFASSLTADWLDHGQFIGIETPELLSHSIDTLDDFRLVEALLIADVVHLPWLTTRRPS